MKTKKLMTALTGTLAAALLLAPAASAATTEFSFELKNDPSYAITIPSSVSVEKGGTVVEVTASEVKDLDGKSISVTIESTNYYRNQMILEREVSSGPRDSMRYQIITENGDVLETTGDKDQMVGREVVSFTQDGTATYTVKPVIKDTNKAGVFEGTMTFGIEVLD